MKSIKKTFSIVLCLLPTFILVPVIAFSQGDTAEVKIRNFSPEKLKSFQENEAYNYQVAEPENDEGSSLLADLIRKLFNFSTKSEMESFWTVLAVLLAVAFVGFFIIRIANAEKSWFWKSKGKKRQSDSSFEAIENIEDPDFHQLIREAVENKDYKVAVRLFYLQMLQDLNSRSLISWSVAKTNSDYYKEISSKSLKEQFSNSALIYEYIWYGDFHVSEPIFESARKSFQLFEEELISSR